MTKFNQIQCLLFVVNTERRESVRRLRSSGDQRLAKAYALLPHVVASSLSQSSRQIFSLNGIKVIHKDQEYLAFQSALYQNDIEVMELFFAGDREIVVYDDCYEPQFKVLTRFSTADRDKTFTKNAIKSVVPKGAVILASDRASYRSAVDRENIEVLSRLLKHQADIRYRHFKGGTFLHLAVKRNAQDLVRLLLAHGADMNVQRRDGSTPLYTALERRFYQVFRMLLENGASVHLKDVSGETCLNKAAERGQKQMVQLLLERGADVNSRASSFLDYGLGSTPLHAAIRLKNLEVIKLLLSYGADVNACSNWERSILEKAVDSGVPEIVKTILLHQPVLNDVNNKRAFYNAITTQTDEAKKMGDMFLHYGFVPGADLKTDYYFWHCVVRQNRLQILQKFLRHRGIDVTCPYTGEHNDLPKKVTLLHTAAGHADVDMINLLVKSGADVHARCGKEKTPIFYAIESDNLQGVELLLNLGARTDSIDSSGKNVLHVAATRGCVEIIKLLIQSGADIQAYCNDDYKEWTPLFYATKARHLAVIKTLLENGAEVNRRKPWQRSALHIAAANGFLEIVEFFLLHGADMNAQPEKNDLDLECTPIVEAAGLGFADVVRILLLFGASVDMKDELKHSAFHFAARNSPDTLEYLLVYFFTDFGLLSRTNICNFFDVSKIGDNFFYSRENFEKSSVVLAKHVIKMKAAGLLVEGQDFSVPWHCTEMTESEFENKCTEEISRLKAEHFGNLPATFYDVLTNSTYQNTCYAKNEIIANALKNSEYYNKFPIYARIIYQQYYEGWQRKGLLLQGIKIFNSLFPGFFTLPRELKEKVINYLSNKDLIILKTACTPTTSE